MNFRLAVAPVLAVAVLGACASMEAGPSATAALKPTQGNATAGTVRFVQKGGKVLVVADVSGLKPGSEHGFHVHEKGDCSAPDAMSAGGHFNPVGKPHAHHGQGERHAGDMPNLKADASGNAKYSFETDLLAVGSGAANVVGRSVVIHRDPDDYKTQPAGNSGPRVACGVIAAS
ncbi:MAG: superoxide dismutase family protein [Betaproteobacteria bacterium]